VLEVLPGDPEKLLAFTRGAAIGYQRKNWGGFIACEWYGGGWRGGGPSPL